MTVKALLGVLFFVSLSQGAWAAPAKAISLKCSSITPEFEIHLNVEKFEVDGVGKDATGKIGSFELSFINRDGLEWDVIPSVEVGTMAGKEVSSVKYSGRRYVDHLKFELGNAVKASAGMSVDVSDFIVSPEYKVVKTIPQANEWDKTWTWDVEVRKHSAVMPLSINDHHGDYVPLDCYSTAMVNDSHSKRSARP